MYDHIVMIILLRSLLLAAFVHSAHADPNFVDLSADLEITSWGNSAYDNPPMFKSTLWKIRCVVGTNSWLISASDQAASAYTWQYTGSNLVRSVPTTDPAKPSKHITDFNGDLTAAQDDEFISPAVRISWLAFCSGPLLSRPEKQVPLPSVFKWLMPSDYTSPPSGLLNDVVLFDDDLGLPISIDVVSKLGQPVLQYRTLQGRVASPASTNIAGWLFPLEFRAIQYGRIRKTNINWQSDLIVHGRLTSIKVGAPP